MDFEFAPILLDREICRDFERSSRLERVDTNDTGGFAMGTVAGVHTRRYHGLLIAALDPPTHRCLMLSRIDEQVEYDKAVFDLATNAFADGVHPCGYELLDLFRLDPYPIWVWAVKDASIIKRVFLVKGKNAVIVEYTCTRPCTLRARPLLACRGYHSVQQAGDEFKTAIDHGQGHFQIQPNADFPPLTLYFDENASFEEHCEWVRGFQYAKDQERGEPHAEDLFQPGVITLNLEPGRISWIVGNIGDQDHYDERRVKELTESYR